jgi:hypothetical protein
MRTWVGHKLFLRRGSEELDQITIASTQHLEKTPWQGLERLCEFQDLTPLVPTLAVVDTFGRTTGLFASGKIAESELDSAPPAPTEQGRHTHFDLAMVEQRQAFAPEFAVKDNSRFVVALVVAVELAFDWELAGVAGKGAAVC